MCAQLPHCATPSKRFSPSGALSPLAMWPLATLDGALSPQSMLRGLCTFCKVARGSAVCIDVRVLRAAGPLHEVRTVAVAAIRDAVTGVSPPRQTHKYVRDAGSREAMTAERGSTTEGGRERSRPPQGHNPGPRSLLLRTPCYVHHPVDQVCRTCFHLVASLQRLR